MRQRLMVLLGLGLLQACRGEERQAPDPADLVIAKTDTLSGDQQVGVAGTMLGQSLRVVVTRDDGPAEGVTVLWSTPEGSVTPQSAPTDADGISRAAWTLKHLFAEQVAFASITNGPPVAVSPSRCWVPREGTSSSPRTSPWSRGRP